MLDLIVSVPDHCLSNYFEIKRAINGPLKGHDVDMPLKSRCRLK